MPTRENDKERLREYNVRQKRDGRRWGERYTPERLERMWLRTDRANFLRYYLLHEPHLHGDRLRYKLRQGAGIERWHGSGKFGSYMSWRKVGECADALGVPMELLVDEDYYFARWGIAGYRILCEAYRQGMSMRELTQNDYVDAHPGCSNWWYYSWYAIFLSKASLKGRLPLNWVSDIFVTCRERLGVTLGSLVSGQLHSAKVVGVYHELTNALTALGPREVATVAGMAKALHDHKHAGAPLQDNVERLLRWYCGSEKQG